MFKEVVYDEYYNHSDKTVLIRTRPGYVNVPPFMRFDISVTPLVCAPTGAEAAVANYQRSMRVRGSLSR
jgi:hypothetical protein